MNNVTAKEHTITTTDGFPLASTIFTGKEKSKEVILIASGVGVPRYAYFKFARFLASNGYIVITFDYRGIHESSDPDFSPGMMRMQEWGTKDIEAVLQFAVNALEAKKLYYVGHSGGGQLVGLAASSIHINGIVFLSVALGHWRYWPGFWKWGVGAFFYLLPVLSWKRDNFPARLLGFSSIDIPSGVVRQWSRWGRSANYLFDHVDPEHRNQYAQIDVPLLSISFDDDDRLGPERAVDEILRHLPNAHISRRHLKPSDYSASQIGHFGFFKQKFESSLWTEVSEWIQSVNES